MQTKYKETHNPLKSKLASVLPGKQQFFDPVGAKPQHLEELFSLLDVGDF
jgi:hypothetical protein